MTASSRGSRAAASLIRSSRHPRICSECCTRIPYKPSLRRPYSAAASVFKPESSPPIQDARISKLPPVTASSSPNGYVTKSGLLLSRPPLLTRELSPFEESFFFYQKRLNERLAMPFSRYFYFKKDTPADADWKMKAKERGGQPARELGGYNAYGDEGWNDELLVDDGLSKTETVMEKLVRDSVVRAIEGKGGEVVEVGEGKGLEDIERPLGRTTESDEKNDVKRLDRCLGRTLYLVVREMGHWRFPSGKLEGRENLHQAAERVLVQSAGVNMNTWIIGHAPFGHYIKEPQYAPDNTIRKEGEKTFFMKARIMAGQANLEGNQFGLEDFRWLTKEEIKKHVGEKYYSDVKNMLSDR